MITWDNVDREASSSQTAKWDNKPGERKEAGWVTQMCYLIYVTGILIENHLISGTELGAEGTMTTKDKPLYSGRFMVWGGVRETDIKQIIYTLKQL